jgi:ribosomal protein S18 acetylase RimI-like enzyme
MDSHYLERFLNRPIKPYHFLESRLGSDRINNYFQNMISKAPNLTALDKGFAIISWKESLWDTNNTGFKTTRINFLMAHGTAEEQSFHCQELYEKTETELSTLNHEYLLYRFHKSDLPALQMVQKKNFHLVDCLITFMWDCEAKLILKNKIQIRAAEESDLESLRNIARMQFTFDRFHNDPIIPNSVADELHANWISDSLSINPNDRVIVAYYNNNISGFLSYSINSALNDALGIKTMSIVLIAIHPEKQRQGIAKALVLEAMKIAKTDAFTSVLVGTQKKNFKAMNLYNSLGFQNVDANFTMRKILKPKSLHQT